MAKLSDTQLIVLSKAAAREDGAAVVPPKMNKAAAVKIGFSLIGRKLMREIRSKPGMPVWREDVVTKPPPRHAASSVEFNDFVMGGETVSFEDQLENIETSAALVARARAGLPESNGIESPTLSGQRA